MPEIKYVKFTLIAVERNKMEHKISGFLEIVLSILILLIAGKAVSAEPYPFPDLAGEPNFINFEDFTAFAANWQKTSGQLAGDFDDSNTVDFDDLAYLSFYWLTERWECSKMDIDESGRIDFADFAIFANNWQKSGANLRGDFDCSGKVDLDDLKYLSYYWLTEQWECSKIDIDTSGRIDFADFVIFADCWLQDVGDANYSSDCDFDDNGQVDIYDLKAFCDCWLKGATPQDIWGKFKAALATGDINEAVSYFTEISAEKYRILFQELEAYLPQMAADMGELIFIEQSEEMAYYDLLRQENGDTYGYPVIFVMDETGQWRIYDF